MQKSPQILLVAFMRCLGSAFATGNSATFLAIEMALTGFDLLESNISIAGSLLYFEALGYSFGSF